MNQAPIIIGGNGHSGTRLFVDILLECGVYMGLSRISYDRDSKDLNIRGILDKWIKSYLLGQSEQQTQKMKNELSRRIQLLVPFRSNPWGFKNPRSMFLLPLYNEMFPGMKFIHVIRDGRDMCFGNPFIESPTYWGFVTDDEVRTLGREELMMRFWGESNRRVREFGQSELGDRYLLVRFEDICDRPSEWAQKIVEFAGYPTNRMADFVALVRRPKSIGRWKQFDSKEVEKVVALGQEYLADFGYS